LVILCHNYTTVMSMDWKEWTKFPDIEGEKVRALRALVFREVLRQKKFQYSWTVNYVKSATLIAARSVLFFVYNGNKPVSWKALENYLREKYGYAEGTVYGYNQHLLSYLIESDGEVFRLRENIYEEAIRILEDDEYPKQVIEEAEELEIQVLDEIDRMRRELYYDDDDEEDEDDEEADNEDEVSEPSVKLVLKDGSRVRIVLEVQLVVKGVRFEVV